MKNAWIGTRVALMLAVFVGAVAVGAAASPSHIGDTTRARQMNALLTRIASEACPLQCQYTCSDDDKHETEEHVNSTSGGTPHGCQFSEKGCQDHTCSEMSADNITQAEGVLRSLDGDELRFLLATQSALSINAERGAAQLEGCGRRIVLSLRLTRTQIAALTH
jgi:hypothetical protein